MGERRTRAKVGQQDKRKKYRLDESLSPSFPLLLSSPFPVPFPLSLFFPPRRTMRGKVCDRRKKWTAAIMEFRATRVVLLPPPQRSLVQRQLCWMNRCERGREKERKSETAWEGKGREGAFTTSGLDFFFFFFFLSSFSSLFLSSCPAACHYISSRLSTFLPDAFAKRHTLLVSLTVLARILPLFSSYDA